MRVAIVTGASRGIGACMARGLAADGYALALAARSERALSALAETIAAERAGDKAGTLVGALDVQDSLAVQAFVESVLAKFGRIDLLVNNAGVLSSGTLELSASDFERVLAINLTGAFNFLKAVVPVMKEQAEGTIINVSSRAGKIGFVGTGAYSASKFALVGLSESLYRELSPHGIKVTTLCPSWVETDMTKDIAVPKQDMLQPDDLLKTVRWLLSLSPTACVRELVIECGKHVF